MVLIQGEVLRVEPAISAADPDTAIAAGVVYSIVPDPVSGQCKFRPPIALTTLTLIFRILQRNCGK